MRVVHVLSGPRLVSRPVRLTPPSPAGPAAPSVPPRSGALALWAFRPAPYNPHTSGMAHPFRVSRLTCLAGLLAACLAGGAPVPVLAGQAAAACQGASCELTVEDAFAAVTQISRQKQEFVGAVRQLILALAGTFGDEGPRIRATLQSMGTVLTAWDRSILQLEERVRAGNRPAEVHLALGVVYLDRYRLDAAQREFAEAGRLNARRADAHTYQALVQTLSNKPAAAAAAFARAAAIDTGRPGLLYSQARQLALAGQDGEAAKALQAFVAAQQARLANPSVAGRRPRALRARGPAAAGARRGADLPARPLRGGLRAAHCVGPTPTHSTSSGRPSTATR